MTPFQTLIDTIHEGKNPYTGFPAGEWAGTWYGDHGAMREVFAQAIDRLNPQLIVEVGTFVGESAIHMAQLIKKQNRSCAILCVDTWYAGFDHWKGAREKIRNHFGRPDFYYKFIANVIQAGCQDVIVPLASDSVNGARIIKWLGLTPQFVYIDASHEEGDVFRDYEHYWETLPSGGGMMADDLSNWFPGVCADWVKFCNQKQLSPVLTQGEKQLLIKP